MAATDRKVRPEDENTFCRTTDVHPVLLTSGRYDRTNHSLGTRDSHLRSGQWQGLGRRNQDWNVSAQIARITSENPLADTCGHFEKWTDFRSEVVAIFRAISTAQTQPTPMDVGAMSKGTPSKGGKGAKGSGKRNNQTQQACPTCGNTDHNSPNCPHSDKTCRTCGKVGHLASACRSSGTPQPKAKGGGKKGKGGKGAGTVKTCWNCGENGHLSSQCPEKKVHAVEDLTTASQVGSQDTTMVGAIGSYLGLGSVSEGILEPRSAGEEICSV